MQLLQSLQEQFKDMLKKNVFSRKKYTFVQLSAGEQKKIIVRLDSVDATSQTEEDIKCPMSKCSPSLIHHPPNLGKVTQIAPSGGDVKATFCCILALLKWNVCLQLSTAWLINLSNYLLRQTKCAFCPCSAVFLTGEHCVRMRAQRWEHDSQRGRKKKTTHWCKSPSGILLLFWV